MVGRIRCVAVVGLVLGFGVPGGAGAAQEYQNLQVLPADISRDELGETMLGFLRALGLPRRAGEGCLHCHVGSLDVPRAQWPYEADDKPAKATARRMLAMVRAINDEHLAGLEDRRWPELSVGCVTCHEGRIDPRPIDEVLASALELGGVDSVAVLYRDLHGRYYGAGVYDLRVGTLAALASELAVAGAYSDALSLAAVNEDTHPGEPSARRFTMQLEVQRILDEEGVDAALARFAEMLRDEPGEVATQSVLDGIGWQVYRTGREEEALHLFRANRAAFPEIYFTFESLVEAEFGAGEITRDEIIAAYVAYLERDPGNEMAEAQLTNHRRRN